MLTPSRLPQLTDSHKAKLYDAKLYRMRVPSTCSAKWTKADYIRAIDNCEGWQRASEERCRVQYNRGYLDATQHAPFGMSNEAGCQHPDLDQAYRNGWHDGREKLLGV